MHSKVQHLDAGSCLRQDDLDERGVVGPEPERVGLVRVGGAARRDGRVLAFHCRAGLGRTGTLLAAVLIWRGQGAVEAIETARAVHPRWIQSQEQFAFLEALEDERRRLRVTGECMEAHR